MSNDQYQMKKNSVSLEGDEDVTELDPKIQAMIGRALKATYDDLVNSPIPDRFLVLLAELEAKEQNHEK